MPWRRLWPLWITAATVLAIVVTAIVVVTHQHKPPAGYNAVTGVNVTGALGGKFTTRMQASAPAGTIPDAVPLGQAVQIDHTVGNATGAAVHFRLDRKKLPKDEPSCDVPTKAMNMAVAVFNTGYQAWIPLPTTCMDAELVATVPHFGLFRAWIVPPGEHVYRWNAKGSARTTRVVTSVSTRVISNADGVASYLGDLVRMVSATFFDNLLAQTDNSPYTCNPVSTRFTANVQVTSNAGFRTTAIAGCTANAGGAEQLRIRNGLSVPLAFGPQDGAAAYLKPVLADQTSLDLPGLLEGAFAYARSTFLVPGLGAGTFGIASTAPNTTQMTGQMDIPSVMLGLATAALGVFLPEFRSSDEAMRQIMQEVNRRLALVANEYSLDAVRTTNVASTIRAVVKANPDWTGHLGGALKLVGMATCLTARDLSVSGLANATFTCLGVVFKTDDAELQQMLSDLASNAKLVPGTVQPNTATQFKALASAGAIKVSVTVGKIFNATETYLPFIGVWEVRSSSLRLYPNHMGRMDVNVGACRPGVGNSPICMQHAASTADVSPDGVVITIGKFDVTDHADGTGTHYPNALAAGSVAQGDRYKLVMLRTGVIQLQPLTPHSRQVQGNDKMCSHNASTTDRSQLCNI